MTNQFDNRNRPSDTDMRRIASALVAEAPTAPPFPGAVDTEGPVQLITPQSQPSPRRIVWPLAIAACLLVLAGVAFLGPWSRSKDEISTNTVASQPDGDSNSPNQQATTSTTPPIPSPPPVPSIDAAEGPPVVSTDPPPPEAPESTAFDPSTVETPTPEPTAIPQSAGASLGTPLSATESEPTPLTAPGGSAPGLLIVPGSSPGTDLTYVWDTPDLDGEGRILADVNPVTGEVTPFPLLTETIYGQSLVLRVIEGQPGDSAVKVQAPVRPHGQSVWISTQDATFYRTDVRIEVDVATGQLTVYRGEQLVLTTPIAWGRPDRPTALHETYVEQLLTSDELGPEYGNWILMIASYSEVLPSFRGGLPAQTIRGTDREEGIGQASTSGGISLPNAMMDELAAIDGLIGAPVLIFDSSDPQNREQLLARPWVPAPTVPDTGSLEPPTFGFG